MNAVASPIPVPVQIEVQPGPGLLADVGSGPSLAAHRSRYGVLSTPDLSALLSLIEGAGIRGRGGAAFPFATKLRLSASGRVRPYLVINLSESEPASAKDAALALTRPHLVLDGAAATAAALGAKEAHLALPGKRPEVVTAVRRAVAEREDRVRWVTHVGDARFVAGQSRAVLELLAGRPNKPVTAWDPEAKSGHKGRPTLLSNAETWAQVGRLVLVGAQAYAATGSGGEPGTTLLTLNRTGTVPRVIEVAFGTPWSAALPPAWHGGRYLIGGFHGVWADWTMLDSLRVSANDMRAANLPLGAGAVWALHEDQCPVVATSEVVGYLAAESSGRCGPCLNGLPALAAALHGVRTGAAGPTEVGRLARLVAGRGACAHPDGTVRLVDSLFRTFAAEVHAHTSRVCLVGQREPV